MRALIRQSILAFGLCALLLSSEAWADGSVGQVAPALQTPTLDGKSFDLSALKGKVVVVNFWATWCGPCREELPALEAVWREYHSRGLEMVAISADRARDRSEVDQVVHYFTFPAAVLGSVTKNDFGQPSTIPITYVIGKDGNISNIFTPDVTLVTEQSLGSTVKGLLDAKADAKPDAKSSGATESKSDDKSDGKADPKP